MHSAGDNATLDLPLVITIDGPAASGKGTIARRLASIMGFAHLDTGVLYRSLALLVDPDQPASMIEQQAATVAATINYELTAELACHPQLRSLQISNAAASIAKIPRVRQVLRSFQRCFVTAPPDSCAGVVLDGRDTGTVVYPEAEAKLFITASQETRARRRWQELRALQPTVDLEQVRRELQFRDLQDSRRAIAPLRAAPEAVILDTTVLSSEQCLEEVVQLLAHYSRLAPYLAGFGIDPDHKIP